MRPPPAVTCLLPESKPVSLIPNNLPARKMSAYSSLTNKAMSLLKSKSRVTWLALAIASLVLVLTAGALSRTPGQKSTPPPATATASQPKIIWSENQLNVSLSPGQHTLKNVVFSSTGDLSNIAIEPVPELGRFLSVTPNKISVAHAGQQIALQLAFTVSPNTTLETYSGTVHIRSEKRTLPETFKVNLTVALQDFTNTNLGVEFKFPLDLTPVTPNDSQQAVLIQSSPKEIVLGGALPEGKSPDDYVTSGFVITVSHIDYPKPFSVTQWLADFHPHSVLNTSSMTTVAGTTAYEVTLKDEVQAGGPIVLVPRGGKLFVLSYNSSFEENSQEEQDGLSALSTILKTLQFTQ